ncbi:MAG: DUF3298 domain-containing protein [Xanthomonadales bacterium]|nr:DUF3298 domain-containing protein [Xanthomonadales bacterium]
MIPNSVWRRTRGSLLAGCLSVMACLLAACGHPPAPQAPAEPAIVASTPAPADSAAVPADHTTTPRYAIAIDFPTLPPGADVLMQALHDHATAAKREFMQALPDPQKFPEFASRQLQLLIEYRVTAGSPAFISVRGTGMMDTGGAHPLPLDASFVLDRQARRVLELGDLFVDPDAARDLLATYARSALERKLLAQAPGQNEATPEARREWLDNMRGMIADGTQPEAKNFAEFQVDAGGLLLVFPPYQVAPYVYGAQTVEVPLEVFAAALKPQYRAAFGSPR